VQQHEQDEEDPDREEDRRRVAADPEPARDRVQPAPPEREDEQHDAGEQPEQRVALAQTPRANQLEDDEQQEQRRDRRRDRDS